MQGGVAVKIGAMSNGVGESNSDFKILSVLYFFCIPELRCSVKVDGCTTRLFCCRKALVGVLRLNYAIALFSATAILNWLGAYILRFNL